MESIFEFVVKNEEDFVNFIAEKRQRKGLSELLDTDIIEAVYDLQDDFELSQNSDKHTTIENIFKPIDHSYEL